MRPLEGVKVLELGRLVAAPWAGQMLGDLGAEVIKVERPGTGDDVRSVGPRLRTTGGGISELTSYFTSMNRNK